MGNWEDLRARELIPGAHHEVVVQTPKRRDSTPAFAEGSAGMAPQAAKRSSRHAVVPDIASSRAALVALVLAAAGFIAAAIAFALR